LTTSSLEESSLALMMKSAEGEKHKSAGCQKDEKKWLDDAHARMKRIFAKRLWGEKRSTGVSGRKEATKGNGGEKTSR